MSDDKTEELKKNIFSPSQWVRILYMVFYAVACWVSTFILMVIIGVQVLISLITGEDNADLRKFGRKVADYFHEALCFLVYASHDKPWPFADTDDAGKVGAAEPENAARAEDDDVFADISFTDPEPDSEDVPEHPQGGGPGKSTAESSEDDNDTDAGSAHDKKDPS